MKLTETLEWNHVHSTESDIGATTAIDEKVQDKNDDDIIISTTPEYFTKLAEDEINVQKATDFLKKLGIKVKTEYGNYRPTYDVLRDIGDAMSRY